MKKFFASCPVGLEDLLIQEASESNLKSEKARGGAHLSGEWERAFHFILWSRIASRVYLHIGDFEIFNEKELAKKVAKIFWEDWFMEDQSLKISTLLDREAHRYFRNSLFLSQLTKDGICDRLREKRGVRPDVNLDNPDLSILLRIEASEKNSRWKCSLWLDMVGIPMHNRGYRNSMHEAPLRENLAAGCVLLSDWNRVEPLIDPFCGSGTLIVEAVMIGAGLPPSILRYAQGYSFFNHVYFKRNTKLHDEWMNLVNHIKEIHKSNKIIAEGLKIYGSDLSHKYLEMTRQSLFRLGLSENTVNLSREDATRVAPPTESGIVITNPPYGKRLEEKSDAENLMHNFGENLKSLYKGHRAYILLGDPELRKKIALQTSRRIELRNGDIDCRLVKYDLY